MRDIRAPDRAIARLAARQGGVVSARQLAAAALSRQAVHGRVRRGLLHPVHRGVYAVGHPAISVLGRRWAAVLALGDGAFVSHEAAADAFAIRPSSSWLVHVSVRGRGGRGPRPGIRIHRPHLLPDEEVTALDGLPITTPARTLLDLAATGLTGRGLEAAVDRAEQQRLLDFADLRELLARHPRRPGTRRLEALLASYSAPLDTRSHLEELVIELCDAHDLPRPLVNCVIEGRVRDFYWPSRRLVVEADGYAWHRSPSAFNDDRERDVELALAGLRGLRFTWHQVTRRRPYVADAILRGLGAR
jgi:predicted transcriptional regulator of viral defense system